MTKGDMDGVWYFKPILSTMQPVKFDPYSGEPNKAFLALSYDSKWTGTFAGESIDYGMAITHGENVMAFVDAIWFDSVQVGDASGSLGLDVIGDRPEVGVDWRGTWVISGGSGDLKDLRGHGTFWGPGWLGDPEEYGIVYYSVEELDGIDL